MPRFLYHLLYAFRFLTRAQGISIRDAWAYPLPDKLGSPFEDADIDMSYWSECYE